MYSRNMWDMIVDMKEAVVTAIIVTGVVSAMITGIVAGTIYSYNITKIAIEAGLERSVLPGSSGIYWVYPKDNIEKENDDK